MSLTLWMTGRCRMPYSWCNAKPTDDNVQWKTKPPMMPNFSHGNGSNTTVSQKTLDLHVYTLCTPGKWVHLVSTLHVLFLLHHPAYDNMVLLLRKQDNHHGFIQLEQKMGQPKWLKYSCENGLLTILYGTNRRSKNQWWKGEIMLYLCFPSAVSDWQWLEMLLCKSYTKGGKKLGSIIPISHLLFGEHFAPKCCRH